MPTSVGMLNAQIKIGRAKVHLDQLSVAFDEFRKDPYSITRYDDLERSRHIIRIETNMVADKIPCLVGEFAYSLRSGLDNLAWQLALLASDTPPDNMCFYIYGANPRSADKRFNTIVAGLPADAVNVINSLQPYLRGEAYKDDPLWQLNKLNNIDKHRVVAFSHTAINVRLTGVSSAKRRDGNQSIELAVPLQEKARVQLDLGVPEPIFGEPITFVDVPSDFEISLSGLSDIYKHVRFEVLPRFESFFA